MFEKLKITDKTVLPKGYNVHKRIESLMSDKKTKMRDYIDIIEKVKNGETVKKEQYNALVNSLYDIENNISITANEYTKYNKLITQKRKDAESQIKTKTNENNILKEKQGLHINQGDIKRIVENIRSIASIRKEKNVLKPVEYIVVDNGPITRPAPIPVQPPPIQPIAPVPVKKGKKIVDKKTIEEIKSNVKNVLKEKIKAGIIKFGNKEQCLSRKKATFMSKNDLIKVIDEHDDLKTLVPKNYKKLSKEDLCEHLFSGKN